MYNSRKHVRINHLNNRLHKLYEMQAVHSLPILNIMVKTVKKITRLEKVHESTLEGVITCLSGVKP